MYISEFHHELVSLLSRLSKFFDKICIFLSSSLYLLLFLSEGFISRFVYNWNLLINMVDMPLNFLCSSWILIVTSALTHKFDVFLVNILHLRLVVFFIWVFWLHCFFDLLCYFLYSYTSFFGHLFLLLKLLGE